MYSNKVILDKNNDIITTALKEDIYINDFKVLKVPYAIMDTEEFVDEIDTICRDYLQEENSFIYEKNVEYFRETWIFFGKNFSDEIFTYLILKYT